MAAMTSSVAAMAVRRCDRSYGESGVRCPA